MVWFRSKGHEVEYDLKDPSVLDLMGGAEEFASRRNLGPRKKKA
jgi:hypothetical protein